MLNDKYKDRSIIIHIVLALIVIVFIGRLAQLQLYEDYTGVAEDNAFANALSLKYLSVISNTIVNVLNSLFS